MQYFWNALRVELACKGPYVASIRAMRLKLPELQKSNLEAKKLRSKDLPEGWEDIESVLQHQGLLYAPEIIHLEVISCDYDNPLAGYFGIEKTRKIVARKYFWSTLR